MSFFSKIWKEATRPVKQVGEFVGDVFGSAATGGGVIGFVTGIGLALSTGGAALALMPLGTLGTIAAAGAVGGMLGYTAGSVVDVLTMDFDIDVPEVGMGTPTYEGSFPVLTVQEGSPIPIAFGRCLLAGNILRANDPSKSNNIKMIVGHCEGEVYSDYDPPVPLCVLVNNLPWCTLKGTHYRWFHEGSATQSGVTNLFDDDESCNYRGLAVSEFKFTKNNDIRGVPNINVVGRWKKCLNIGQAKGGTTSFTRNPAQIMWHWYVDIEGYSPDQLDQDAFTALETYCATIPSNSDTVPLRPPGPDDNTVRATTYYNADTKPLYALKKDASLTGSRDKAGWLSATGSKAQQRLNIDFGAGYLVDKVVIENYHNAGLHTNTGAKHVYFYGSNQSSAFADTAWASPGWEDLISGGVSVTIDQHVAEDRSDPQTISFSGVTTAYRYYSLAIEDNWGNSSYVGIRDIKFYGKSPRYTFDFVFDSKTTINDAKKLIWKSFNGRCITSQGKIKPVWDAAEEHDGASGLQAKAVKHNFTQDNIVKGSISWGKVKKPNIVRIHYINAHDGFKKTLVEVKDERDIEAKGEIVYEETCWWITEPDVAKRRAQYKFDKARCTDYVCRLTGFPDSSDLEVYDRVQVTHSLPGWSNKDFIVRSKSEDQYGRPVFNLEAYWSGIYHDRGAEEQENYAAHLPNPKEAPPACENVSLSNVASAGGGSAMLSGAIEITFDQIDDVFYSYTEIYVSTDDSTYYYAGTTEGTTARVDGCGTLWQPGDRVYVKLRNVNVNGIMQPMPTSADASITAGGYMRLASFYAGLTDFWGGNENIGNAATKIVLGDLDGTPKIALGSSADSLTISNMASYPGFYVDGNGYFRGGGSEKYIQWNGELTIAGTINAAAGTFTGYVTAGTAKFGVDVTAGNDGIWLDANNYWYTTGMKATAGTVGGWTLGTDKLSAGSITLDADSTYPSIRMGDATGFMSGTGIWMGKHTDGNYTVHIGNPNDQYLKWDGSDLTITGAYIGGSDIGATTANTFTINDDANDVNVQLILDRTTGGPATLQWDGSELTSNVSVDTSGSLQQIATKDYVDLSVTSLGASYYMTDTSSGVSDYQLCSLIPSSDAEVYLEGSSLSDGDYLGGWISASGETPDVLLTGGFNFYIIAEKMSGTKTL
ncbi:MAG: hypothetical protein DRG39_05455, partial [Deltaproteobacteria bacterium]